MKVDPQTVELGIIIVQLQAIMPTMRWVRAGVGKLLAYFKLDKQPAPTSPAPTE